MNALKVLLIFALIGLCRAQCNAGTFMDGSFTRCHTLNDNYEFFWKIQGEDVTIGLHLKGFTNPWMGLGISVNGGMMGADIAMASYEEGKYTVQDLYATKFARPAVDAVQNVEMISASHPTEKETIVVYKRKLVSCDADQDQSILENSTQVIWAYGEGSFGYHEGNRGTVVVNFHSVPVELPLPSSYSVFNFTMPNYEIPSKRTTYACVSTILPRAEKYHIVRWRPIIQHPEKIHHMVIFGCFFDPNTTTPYECPMAPSTAACASVVVVWTLGQTGDDFLGEYALPIGKGVSTGVYVVLQMHYNNANNEAGLHDNSGIQLFYSNQLRKYDVGTVPMSTPWANKFLQLPPGKTDNYRYTRCHSECTSKSIPADGVTIINWFPHLHELGSKIWLSHIRNGVELPEIHRDNNYDFERQQNFPIWRTIYPGDSLIMHCMWDTSSKTTVTYGGEETNDEMCIGIFQYYPAFPNFTRCTDLHEYLNTTGNGLSLSTCTRNNQTAINPFTNTSFSGGVTPVIANPDYVPLTPRVTNCPAINPTKGPSSSSDNESSANSNSIISNAFVFFLLSCFLALML